MKIQALSRPTRCFCAGYMIHCLIIHSYYSFCLVRIMAAGWNSGQVSSSGLQRRQAKCLSQWIIILSLKSWCQFWDSLPRRVSTRGSWREYKETIAATITAVTIIHVYATVHSLTLNQLLNWWYKKEYIIENHRLPLHRHFNC